MLKIASAIKSHRYLALGLAVVLFGALTGMVFGLSRRSRRAQSPAITTNSRTSAMRVLGSEKLNLGGQYMLSLSLQNVSGKDIKAITITVGKMSVTQELFFSDESIARGSVTNRLIPLADEQIEMNAGSEIAFTVAAVAFADGTGDGDVHVAKRLTDEYAGIRDQAKQVAGKLRKLSGGPEGESALADLETEVNALPTKGNGSASAGYEAGLRNARQLLLTRLSEIKQRRQSGNVAAAERQQEKLKTVFESLASAGNSPN